MRKDVGSELLKDAAAFARHWDAINALRSSLSLERDVLLDPIHFLTATDDIRRSCSVAVWRGYQLIGVLYATQHYLRGFPTGYAVGGDFSGRGLLLCDAADENVVLREGMRRMTAEGIHSLHLRFLPRDDSQVRVKGLKMKSFDAVIPGDLLRLEPDFEEFLGKLGKHTRRNIRAFMRKTVQAGIEFAPSLSREEYDEAVARLNAETDFPADPLRLVRDERLMVLHASERMGLRAADGTLVAVLCGFYKNGRFHLLTQLNDVNFERMSLSLVLRSYAIQRLISEGVASLHFMGGSSLSFGRYCQPESYRSIFADRKGGLSAALKMLASRLVRFLKGLGRSVPEMLVTLCSGHLEDAMLTERTVLRPAAMLMSQRQGPYATEGNVSGQDIEFTADQPLLRARASV